MAKKPKLKVVDLNPHLSCILCGGYFIDATTITECLHSFCRACIVRYLETSKYCPVCEIQIHKTRPLRCIRSDRILQNIVYKLVPGLYQNEMSRRRELYASQPPEALKESRDEEDRGEGLEHRFIYICDEMFDIILRYQHKIENSSNTWKEVADSSENNVLQRYMRCPAALKITHLKKFIRYKYDIPSKLTIEILYETNLLDDDYTLMDIAYIYSWKRAGPLHLLFKISDHPTVQVHPMVQPNEDTSVAPLVQDKTSSNNATLSTKTTSHGNAQVLKINKLKSLKTSKRSRKNSSKNSTLKHTSTQQTIHPDRNDKHLLSPRHSVKRNNSVKPKVKHSHSSYKNCTETSGDSSLQPQNDSQERTETLYAKDSINEVEEKLPPLKIPKLTIPLTLKIKQQAAYHAEEEEKIDSDEDLSEDRLVIVETDNADEDNDNKEKESNNDDKGFKKIGSADDYEVDSGRGSDSSVRVEEGSYSGDDIVCSPKSFTHPSPKFSSICSPNSPEFNHFPALNENSGKEKGDRSPMFANNDFGALDLSTCHRKRAHERISLSQPKQVDNPAVLDKNQEIGSYVSSPKHSLFKLLPSVPSPTNKKSEHSRRGFRYDRSSTLTVFNPDPNSHRTKIVIKNLDPKPRHY